MSSNGNRNRIHTHYVDSLGSRRTAKAFPWKTQFRILEFLAKYEDTDRNVYGRYASDEWIKHMMDFLGEEVDFAPDDVKIWIATDKLFKDWNRRNGYDYSTLKVNSKGEFTFCNDAAPHPVAQPRPIRLPVLPNPREPFMPSRRHRGTITTPGLYGGTSAIPLIDISGSPSPPTLLVEPNASKSGNPNFNSAATGATISAGNQLNTLEELQVVANRMNSALMKEQNAKSNGSLNKEQLDFFLKMSGSLQRMINLIRSD